MEARDLMIEGWPRSLRGMAESWEVWRTVSADAAEARRRLFEEVRGHFGRRARPNGHTFIPETSDCFWVNLAVLQWLDGCLEDEVRVKARRAVARLEPAEGEADLGVEARQRAHEVLRMIDTPSPRRKRFGRRSLATSEAEVGDCLPIVVNDLARETVTDDLRVESHWEDTPKLLVCVGHARHGWRIIPVCTTVWTDWRTAPDPELRARVKSELSPRDRPRFRTTHRLPQNGAWHGLSRVLEIRAAGDRRRAILVVATNGRGGAHPHACVCSFGPGDPVVQSLTVTEPRELRVRRRDGEWCDGSRWVSGS